MSTQKGELAASVGFTLALTFALLVAALGLSGCNRGCDNAFGSCIEIGEPQPEPDVCFVEDECIEDVIAEFCDDTALLQELAYNRGYRAGFEAAPECDNIPPGALVSTQERYLEAPHNQREYGFQEGVESVVCKGGHQHQHGKGHQEHGNGKGKGHGKG